MPASRIDTEQYRVRPGQEVQLADFPTSTTDGFQGGKAAGKQALTELNARLADLQQLLYADGRHKVLVVLQGMDTSGKDGTIKHVFRTINPLGVRVANFKRPNDIELAHDFLWRVHEHAPRNGRISIFNRSHYEDVLVPRVLGDIDGKETKRRYAHIRDFERMLAESGTTVVKIFLHLSKDEQKKRLQERLDDPEKHWKFDPTDLVVRSQWDAYQRAYEDAIAATDIDHAPWYIVPADSKTHRNLIVAHLLLETMQAMNLSWPAPKADLAKVKVE